MAFNLSPEAARELTSTHSRRLYHAGVLSAAPGLPIVTLDGVNRMGPIVEDRALEAIAGWVRRLP